MSCDGRGGAGVSGALLLQEKRAKTKRKVLRWLLCVQVKLSVKCVPVRCASLELCSILMHTGDKWSERQRCVSPCECF